MPKEKEMDHYAKTKEELRTIIMTSCNPVILIIHARARNYKLVKDHELARGFAAS